MDTIFSKNLQKIPYHLVLEITRNVIIKLTGKEKNTNYTRFYGKFKHDRTNKVFLVFESFLTTSANVVIPMGTKYIDFLKDFYLDEKTAKMFFSTYKQLRSMFGVSISAGGSKYLNITQYLESIELKIEKRTIQLYSLKPIVLKLKQLKEITINCCLGERASISFISFALLIKLSILYLDGFSINKSTVNELFKLNKLKVLQFNYCDLCDDLYCLFESKSIEKIVFDSCVFKSSKLKNVKKVEGSNLKYVEITMDKFQSSNEGVNSNLIPHQFLQCLSQNGIMEEIQLYDCVISNEQMKLLKNISEDKDSVQDQSTIDVKEQQKSESEMISELFSNSMKNGVRLINARINDEFFHQQNEKRWWKYVTVFLYE